MLYYCNIVFSSVGKMSHLGNSALLMIAKQSVIYKLYEKLFLCIIFTILKLCMLYVFADKVDSIYYDNYFMSIVALH